MKQIAAIISFLGLAIGSYSHASGEFSDDSGLIRTEYLVRRTYEPSAGWDGLGIKEKAKIASVYAIEQLNNLRYEFVKTHESTGATSNIFYDLQLKRAEEADAEEKTTSLEDLSSYFSKGPLKVIINYHYRADGRLPDYNPGVFGGTWIKKRCESVGIASFDPKNIITLASVLDRKSTVDLYIVTRSDIKLRTASWILRNAFDLFESKKDKLETELCFLLLRSISPFSASRTDDARRDKIQEELGALETLD